MDIPWTVDGQRHDGLPYLGEASPGLDCQKVEMTDGKLMNLLANPGRNATIHSECNALQQNLSPANWSPPALPFAVFAVQMLIHLCIGPGMTGPGGGRAQIDCVNLCAALLSWSHRPPSAPLGLQQKSKVITIL
uniref:Uncharacterized protein n=1 Tax=Anopheles coluzzii TaxID=1518534 RepID=A0A8W7PDW4_ANOCL